MQEIGVPFLHKTPGVMVSPEMCVKYLGKTVFLLDTCRDPKAHIIPMQSVWVAIKWKLEGPALQETEGSLSLWASIFRPVKWTRDFYTFSLTRPFWALSNIMWESALKVKSEDLVASMLLNLGPDWPWLCKAVLCIVTRFSGINSTH